MPKLRSISARLVLAISSAVAVACLVLAVFSDLRQQATQALALDQQLQLQYQAVLATLDYEARTARVLATAMAALPPIEQATAQQDRATILGLLGPVFAAIKQQGIPIANVTLPPATLLVRLWDPKSFGDDVSARRQTLVAANARAVPISGIESGRDILSIYGVAPMLRDGKSIGVVDVGVSFDQAFVDRLKRRFAVDLAVHVRDGDGFKTISSTFAERTTASAGELDAALRGATVRHAARIGGHPAEIHLGQIKSFAGDPVAVLELVKDTTAYEAAAAAARRELIIGSVVIVLAALGVALVLGRGLSRPVTAMTRAMKQLATGDTAVTVPGRTRRDELGTMADAVEIFRSSMIETDRLRAEQEAAKRRAEDERRDALNRLADAFEANVRGVVVAVADGAAAMRQSAERLNTTAERSSEQSAAVSASAEQASVNVQTMAAATEQLAQSIAEISQLVETSTTVIARASDDASRTDRCIQGLADAAERIGGVVKLITHIASQTNLLALNATIEAARAGDAGKGFAVVAAEVKTLAGQTAAATGEIADQVAAIQTATREAVDAIQGISGTIAQVNEIAVGIASAIQQQGAATHEISRNGQQAASGTCDVTANITGVSQATGDTRAAAGDVLSASGRMIAQSVALSEAVDGFLAKVRAA